MTARPILFSAPMVRALLDGRKTQTRRLVKGVPSWDHYGRDIMDWGLSGIHQGDFDEMVGTNRWFLDVQTDVDANSRREIRCPYGAPGDRLWVRESGLESLKTRDFKLFAHDASPGRYWVDSDGGRYGAGYNVEACGREHMLRVGGWKVRPSIHMPRWASRISLAVSEVRVERLQDISEGDAQAEGVDGSGDTSVWPPCAKAAYSDLWDHINGPGSWAANPWVWAVSFSVHQQNIDQFQGAPA